MTEQPGPGQEIEIDLDNLYREEVFTDLGGATIRRLLPVDRAGTPDPSRPPQFIGEATLMTRMGPVPAQFPIEAASLEEAFGKFPAELNVAIERMTERARELAREEASRIVVPSAGEPGPAPGGGMPGAPGGGRIVLK